MKTILKITILIIAMGLSFAIKAVTKPIKTTEVGHIPEPFGTKEQCRSMENDLNRIADTIKKMKEKLAEIKDASKQASLITDIATQQQKETNLEKNYAIECEIFGKKK
jgi:Skp family chaperone for outer membrane proteins